MKKLLIIPVLCLMFLAMQGSDSSDDFTYIVDSLKTGTDTTASDTTDSWDIIGLYNQLFKHQYLTWTDTGATYTDSVHIYGTDAGGNKFLCQLENLSKRLVDSVGSELKTNVTSGANATTIYKIIPEYLKAIEVVRNGNVIYTTNVRGKYTLTLVNE